MSLDSLLGAIRAADGDAGAGADGAELAAATRLRVMRSLDSRARGRHQLVGLATAVAILFVGTVSWALATGQVAALWSPAPAAEPPAPPVAPAVVPSPPAPVRRHPASRPVPRLPAELPAPPELPEPPEPPEPIAQPAMSIDPRPTSVPEVSPPETVPPAPRVPRAAVGSRPPRPAPPPVEVLYRRAHELHFHGGDPAAALAAWDTYLAAEPDGRFSVEARYNRALLLVRLGRHAEARTALLPFARGEVVPGGYRQSEAEQLVERLADDE